MYEVILTYEEESVTIPALQYLRLLRSNKPVYEFDEAGEVELKNCSKQEKATILGNYVLHIARLGGWQTVTVSGEAAHLLDILIDEPRFLHGAIEDFGTILRNVADPLALDDEVVRVQNLKEDTIAIADIAAAPVLLEVVKDLRKKFPLDSPTKKDTYANLKAAIEKSTKTTAAELMKELATRLGSDDIRKTPPETDKEDDDDD